MSVLVVAPHPDDESIGCGGAIASHRQAGRRVVVAFMSSGEQGVGCPPEEAGRIREAEAEAAAAVLDVSDLRFLRHPDGHLSEHAAAIAADLVRVVDEVQPGVILIPNPDDDHPDHQAIRPVLEIAYPAQVEPMVTAYEVWTPLRRFTEVLDISALFETKTRAIRVYQSQLAQLSYDRAVAGLNQYRGVLAGGCAYAEVFAHMGGGGEPLALDLDW